MICIVSSSGGHLTEVRQFAGVYGKYPHFYVLNYVVPLGADMAGKTEFITHAERDWRVGKNFWEAWRILRARRPKLILTTGAGPAVPFAIVGRLLGIPTIFVESYCRTERPSLTGRLMYYCAARMFYQWPKLGRYFPKAEYGGPLF
jgi:beta-1,4-N-acetylglucosaminyltransferase